MHARDACVLALRVLAEDLHSCSLADARRAHHLRAKSETEEARGDHLPRLHLPTLQPTRPVRAARQVRARDGPEELVSAPGRSWVVVAVHRVEEHAHGALGRRILGRMTAGGSRDPERDGQDEPHRHGEVAPLPGAAGSWSAVLEWATQGHGDGVMVAGILRGSWFGELRLVTIRP